MLKGEEVNFKSIATENLRGDSNLMDDKGNLCSNRGRKIIKVKNNKKMTLLWKFKIVDLTPA